MVKKWYKIYLNNGHETVLIATVKGNVLSAETLAFLETIYPRERYFLLTIK